MNSYSNINCKNKNNDNDYYYSNESLPKLNFSKYPGGNSTELNPQINNSLPTESPPPRSQKPGNKIGN